MTNNQLDARQALLVDVAHLVASTVAGTCCRKTGGKGGPNAHPSCECISAANEIVARFDAFLSSSTEDGGEAEIRKRHDYDHERFFLLGEMGEYVAQAHKDRATLLSTTAALRRFVTSLESDLALSQDLMKMTAGTLEDLLKQGGLLDERGLPTNYKADNETLRSRVGELEKERDKLAALVYVPGLWRCAKCEFKLMQSTLYAQSGTVGPRDDPGEKCPNCNSPLWRVSERDAGNETVDRCEAELKRANTLQSDLEQMRKVTIENCIDIITSETQKAFVDNEGWQMACHSIVNRFRALTHVQSHTGEG